MDLKRKYSVSIAMAVYNGEKYLKEQIESILCQMSLGDELVISLDPSMDKSKEIIEFYSAADDRIKLFNGLGQGLIKNFKNALEKCRNDIIFLADQDDIWCYDKIESVLDYFEDNKVSLVLHDARVVDENRRLIQKSLFAVKKSRLGILRNIIKNSYVGCCMAFRKEYLKFILPFPEKIPMHDQWIGLICEIYGNTVFSKKALIEYRRHGNNVSSDAHASIRQMLIWRVWIIKALIMRRYKVR